MNPQNPECGPHARLCLLRGSMVNWTIGSALYELPIGSGKLLPVANKGLNAVVGGWQVGGIFTHQTGAVATPLVGFDNGSTGGQFGNFDRPNPTGTSPYLSGSARSLNTWVNKAAYVNAAAGFCGNPCKAASHCLGYTAWSARCEQRFSNALHPKSTTSSLRFEAFNALNHPNWNTPTLTLSSSTFGRITGTGSMRQLQLAAKYEF